MPRSAREKSRSGVYHFMLRGINRAQIFNDDEDNEVFLAALRRACDAGGHRLYAYCLMGNHVHAILREGKEPLETLMRSLGAGYVRWYNIKYVRTGSLFEGRYKSEPIEDAAYLIDAIRYVHLNPVKAGLCILPKEYPWSSYRAYEDQNVTLIDTRDVLAYIDRGTLLSVTEPDRISALAEPG